MNNIVVLKEAILSNVTGLDAIQRAPIVLYKTNHKCLRIQNVAHCEPYEKWGYTEVSEKNFYSFQLRKDDIIISRTGGSIGSVMYISKDYNSVFNNGLIRLKIDTTRFDPLFIYYCLKNKQFAKHIMHCSLGNSTQENIRMNDLLEYQIPNHPLDTQKKIASILWELDAKIASDEAVCTDLEAMAKLLYDYWFVQFDFPDENGRPYKSSGGKMVWNEDLKREIPEGWEVKYAADLTKVKTGKEDANFATENGMYAYFTCGQEVLRCDIPAFEGRAVLLAGNGDFNVKHYTGKFNAYQRTYVLIPDDLKYYALLYIATKEAIASFTRGSAGSIVKFITLGDVQGIRLLDPHNDQMLNTFNLLIDKIEQIQFENQQLASLRDFLLPMLMNGQVSVGESEYSQLA